MTEPTISLSLTLAPILGELPPVDHRGVHQLRIGSTTFVHINAETARQWLPVLARIAGEK